MVCIAGRKRVRPIEVRVGGIQVPIKKQARYLGVCIDGSLSFRPHVEGRIEKAQRITETLKRLLPRHNGPSEHRRRVYKNVVESILTYAASIWGPFVVEKKTHIHKLVREQRRIGLYICQAHRTVSADAVLVLSRMIPIDLLILESIRVESTKKKRKDAREETMKEWEKRWREDQKGERTRRLVPNLRQWFDGKHGDIDYAVTQFVTGHGHFGSNIG